MLSGGYPSILLVAPRDEWLSLQQRHRDAQQKLNPKTPSKHGATVVRLVLASLAWLARCISRDCLRVVVGRFHDAWKSACASASPLSYTFAQDRLRVAVSSCTG